MQKTPFEVTKQTFLPQHGLSVIAGWLANSKISWLKRYLINYFLQRYAVNLAEAQQPDPHAYACFNDFFIRKLKPEARTIDPRAQHIISPCDGTLSQFGKIEHQTLIQAKGKHYTLSALLGHTKPHNTFENGCYATIYLAPQDYHRVHMPCAGKLIKMDYIPGKLFSVNPLTTQHVDQLFARNERLVCYFQGEQGVFAVILVGAMLVGSMHTRWAQPHQSCRAKQPYTIEADDNMCDRQLDKGDELGYFTMGSTVILLFNQNCQWLSPLKVGQSLKLGSAIASYI